jgi:hypothetical protein
MLCYQYNSMTNITVTRMHKRTHPGIDTGRLGRD